MKIGTLRAALADESLKPSRDMYIIVREGSCVYYGDGTWTNDEDEATRYASDDDLPEEIDGGAAYRWSYRQPEGPNGPKIWHYVEKRDRRETGSNGAYAEAFIIRTDIY